MKTLCLVLLPAFALAAPPPATRVSALLIPMDSAAEDVSVKLETYLNEALGQFPDFTVKKPEELLGMPVEEAVETSLKRGGQALEEGAAAYAAKDYENAEHKLGAALKELQGAVAAMNDCTDLCEATALYAAVLYRRADIEGAKQSLADLMALAPVFELSPQRYGGDFIALRAQVAAGRASLPASSAVVKSRPEGARVYLDGQFQGYAPMTIGSIRAGKHLLRLDRPGFRRHGEILTMTTKGVDVSVELIPTAAYKKYDAQLDKVAAELVRAESGPATAALGKSLAIDRGVLGTVKEFENGEAQLILGFFDLQSGKKLASRKVVLQGEEYGQLKAEIYRLVAYLVDASRRGAEKPARNPASP